MPDIDFEDGITEGTILWRYMSAEKFISILRDSSFFLSVATNFEDTDLNEGRFTNSYVNVVRNYVRSCGGNPLVTEETEIQIILSNLLAARESSYISCWTLRESESDHMWNAFGDEKRGVVVKSTVGKICEEFYNYCEDNEPFDLKHGLVAYNRENMHRYLSSDEIFNSHFPLFFLSGGVHSFEHERECRFILYDPEENLGVADDLLRDGIVNSCGSVILSDNCRRRVSTQNARGLSIPVDLNNLFLEIRLGGRMSFEIRSRIMELLNRLSLESRCLSSTIR